MINRSLRALYFGSKCALWYPFPEPPASTICTKEARKKSGSSFSRNIRRRGDEKEKKGLMVNFELPPGGDEGRQ